MAIRTKRLTNGLLLKPCSAGSISSLDKLKNGNLINGLIFIDSSDQRLKIQIENQERQILTTSQSQVITNKTISTNDNTIQVSASGVVSTELDAALAEIRMLIDDTSGSEVEIFNSTITIGSTAPSVTGIMYHKATDDIAFKKANIQIFGKNNVYDGVLQMDCKVGNIPDESMQSMFSPATTPTIKFVVAENDTAFNNIENTFGQSTIVTKIEEQIIGTEKKYLIVGDFIFNGDSTKKNIIRLNSDGTEDITFTENATRTLNSPNFNSRINDIVVESTGTLLVAGSFSNFKGSGINGLIRLNSDGSFNPNDTFNTNMVGKFTVDVGANILESCAKVKVIQDNIFYIKIKYESLNNYSYNLVKSNNIGVLDTFFNSASVIGGRIIIDFYLTSSYVYIVGNFLNYGGSTGLNLAARLNIGNGSIDGNFTAATANKFSTGLSSVSQVLVQPDGKIIFSGMFSYDTSNNSLIRLNTDLIIDQEFKNNVNSKAGITNSIILQDNSKLYLKGIYNGYSGIWRLNADGSEDKAFNYFSKNILVYNSDISTFNTFGNLIFYQTKNTSTNNLVLKKVINYPERYNEYMQATRTNEEGFVISTINDGQFVRLDISNIPTGYVGTIQVVLTGVKIL
jgi:hypothetical protein